jgi:hydroxymethylpyrimidine kinase/phosphomethylpyrimidine kinase
MSATNELNDSPAVLTIAGFDPSGGAGVIADIRTFLHFGCRPTAAITSLTFQNSQGVFGATHQSASSLRSQVVAIIEEYRISALKIGMLPTAELVGEVVRLIQEMDLPAPIVDPVFESSSGYRLIEDDAIEGLMSEFVPQARLVTPNIPEAEKLAGLNVHDEEDMRQAAARIRELGARAVLIKGGHLGTQASRLLRSPRKAAGGTPAYRSEAIDLLDDEGQVTIFRGKWIDSQPVRGTGCMLSSAIAAGLAKDLQLCEAVQAAKQFVAREIQNSKLKTQN